MTGVPGSGKSEWLDALLINLSIQYGWGHALCSMENDREEHFAKLAEKFLGMPFFNNGKAARMGKGDLERAREWIDSHFVRLEFEGDDLPTLDWVLDMAKTAVVRHGVRSLVIDPWNEIEHMRPDGLSETEHVSKCLSKIRRFLRHHGLAGWIVAHPRIMRDWKGEAPGLYDVSGSANFVNKPDVGIVINRKWEDDGPSSEAEIWIKKMRRKRAGRVGMTTLQYDPVTGRYSETDAANVGGYSAGRQEEIGGI